MTMLHERAAIMGKLDVIVALKNQPSPNRLGYSTVCASTEAHVTTTQ